MIETEGHVLCKAIPAGLLQPMNRIRAGPSARRPEMSQFEAAIAMMEMKNMGK